MCTKKCSTKFPLIDDKEKIKKELIHNITLDFLFNKNFINAHTYNACMNNNFSNLYDIVTIYNKKRTFIHMPSIGKKANELLISLCENNIKIIIKTYNALYPNITLNGQNNENNNLLKLSNNIYGSKLKLNKNANFALERPLFFYKDILDDEFIKQYYEAYRNLPMLRIAWKYLEGLKQNNKKLFYTLRYSYEVYKDSESLSLMDISKIIGCTKERIRQIKLRQIKLFFTNTTLIFSNIDDWKYLEKTVGNNYLTNKDVNIERILDIEKVPFSISFVMNVLYLLFPQKYQIFGGYFNREDWKNPILIIREITCIFNFDIFRKEFEEKVFNARIYEDIIFDIEKFINNNLLFWQDNFIHFDRINDIVDIAKTIIAYEFDLYPDTENNIIIKANRPKRPSDVVYQILKKNGKPMHISEIFPKFQEILPNSSYGNEGKLRGVLQRHPLIASISNKCTYTLNEWNYTKGSIRNNIIEFLNDCDTPQTIENILAYIIILFPYTNKKSVKTSIMSDTLNRFVKYQTNSVDELFGSSQKYYSDNYTKIIDDPRKKKSFEEKLFEFEQFVIKNNKYPSANSNSYFERLLANWIYRTKKAYLNNNISEEHGKLYIELCKRLS